MNTNWYYRINLADKTAIEYTQIPEVWGNCSGLNAASDETLADMNWAGHNEGFLSSSAALAQGVSQAELDRVLPLAKEVAKAIIRKKRNTLLDASDKAITIDRWEGYSAETKTIISSYRQALRDITTSDDLFSPAWPTIPTELDYLKAL
jgi:hypothetical protein